MLANNTSRSSRGSRDGPDAGTTGSGKGADVELSVDRQGDRVDESVQRGHHVASGSVCDTPLAVRRRTPKGLLHSSGRFRRSCIRPLAFVADLRAALAERLPGYMVPARYGVVDALPLTVNGKLDVAALPEPVRRHGGTARAPRPPERRCCEASRAVLGIAEVGIDDDFFALGGDSISSIAVSGRARKAGLHITPATSSAAAPCAALAASPRAEAPRRRRTRHAASARSRATPMLAETEQSATPLDNFYQSMVLATPAGMTGAQMELVLRSVLDAPRHAAGPARRRRRPAGR